ncbi:FadD32-like long-chain-fatty-acid--AMP ligase [Corynebacterium choanae]|uniref:Long-chain-fatty-acid--AMP ligase FadD32 n=1 Tax=Corynebacterium choanae TaxID=1862358 RepID=A0A3G6J3B7_9CORY|nr:FadD32-like long-chain-fatty-acid--AMP ligase [Corynebacterium choanae]AZA12555.1 Long-chain-fatty-acid--AMP ligase FadD32 [Corynebacterium choanae]
MAAANPVQQFFTDTGQIVVPDHLHLAGVSEALFQADVAAGNADKEVIIFHDYSTSREGTQRHVTRAEVNRRIKAVAARLLQTCSLGGHAAILMGNSPEYVYACLGALYAGMVPVPLYDPNEPGHAEHLDSVLHDSTPAVVLTNTVSAPAVRTYFSHLPAAKRPRILAVDALADSLADSYTSPLESEQGQQLVAQLQQAGIAPADTTAMLQYTSGSTRLPAGVKLTHRSMFTNALQIYVAAQFKSPQRMVSWLPMHHDMGIMLAVMFTIFGMPMDIMQPRDFVQQPSRWLRQLARRADEDYSYTAVPNFALGLAIRYGLPAIDDDLDLSSVDNLILGAEPVQPQALEAFADAFAPYGFQRNALRPSFGQTEASLLLTTPQTLQRPRIEAVDRAALTEDTITLAAADADPATVTHIVSCGEPIPAEHVIIVDPDTREELPEGRVGAIWGYGNNVAGGYYQRDEETADTFGCVLAKKLDTNSRAEGVPADAKWLSTGDRGCILDGELFITGRQKELIIIAGRNHYPLDIEWTATQATSHIRPASLAAFAIPGDDVEQLVVLAEREPDADPAGDEAAVAAIVAAVTARHGIVPKEVKIVEPDSILRSASAKIARRRVQQQYIEQQQ